MNDVLAELESVARNEIPFPQGPRGGNLESPVQRPERRRSEFNGVDLGDGVRGLHTFEDAAVMGLKNEKPWHAMALEFILLGRTNVEIARIAQVHPQEVSTLKAQRWFQEKLALRMAETKQSFDGLIKAEVQASIQMLADIRDDATTSKSLKVKVCQAFMEQGCGKPTQKVLSISARTTYASASEEMEDIQRQLDALRSEADCSLPASNGCAAASSSPPVEGQAGVQPNQNSFTDQPSENG